MDNISHYNNNLEWFKCHLSCRRDLLNGKAQIKYKNETTYKHKNNFYGTTC